MNFLHRSEYEQGTDPQNHDTDDDGLFDGIEVDVHETSPLDADTDDDALPDGWEVQYGLAPLNPRDAMDDPDGDHIVTGYEFEHDTVPTNTASRPATTIYVDVSAPGPGDGSQASPYPAIQTGLNAVTEPYSIVEVADGVYTGALNRDVMLPDVPVLLMSSSSPGSCIVDCQGQDRAMTVQAACDGRWVIEGLTFREGAETDGGAIHCSGAPTIRRCRFEDCSASSKGGAIYNWRGAPDIRRCEFADNSAAAGGVVYSSRADLDVDRCWFTGNEAQSGGALYSVYSGVSRVRSSVFTGNTAEYGGVLWSSDPPVQFVNCTFAHNLTSLGAGVLEHATVASLGAINCIAWTNMPTSFAHAGHAISYSVVEGGYAGTGNLDVNPRLIPGSLRLPSDSPCIDAGTAVDAPDLDVDNEARWDAPAQSNTVSTVDIGADEFVDTDTDDMADAWEHQHFGDLSHAAGGDEETVPDGLTNRDEHDSGTDPNIADSDGDGVVDGAEVHVHLTDPLEQDSDGDNVDDGVELTIGSDPLDPYDIKITGTGVSPVQIDPLTNVADIAFSVNWTSDVRVVIHPVDVSLHYMGAFSVDVQTNEVRILSARFDPGSHTVEWDGRDGSGSIVSNGSYAYTISATNALGLVADTYAPEYVGGPVTVSNFWMGTNFSFQANEPLDVAYELSLPALVAVAVPQAAYPCVWGEARPAGWHTERFDGRHFVDRSLLFGSFKMAIKAEVLPENLVIVNHDPALLEDDLQTEQYLIVPSFSEVSEIHYELREPALVELRVRDPNGNMITVQDATNQTAGAYVVEWMATDDSNRVVNTIGDYEVYLDAESTNGVTRTYTANISVR
ncbi:MAG: hypothetical protein HN919_17205 [Verrucomicrobia bacterium]|nr:hypothetical protein [Verrucomicrobiota bacterium]MBT7068040.1 hypothetical protein [Verrucomicrobiota bacterium]MBT7699157.1 hypothetical protein [Verrucomicrobiota bacterium]